MGWLSLIFQLILCINLFLHLQCQLTSAAVSTSSKQLCNKDESSALLQVKNEFSHDDSASIDCKTKYSWMVSWKENTDCCLWGGVACDNVTGKVIGLDLSCNGLQGNLTSNSSLFLLPHLQSLNLAFNDFNRSMIPSQFGFFANLTHLNLSTSWFSGLVPSEISQLNKLVSLDLSSMEYLSLDAHTMHMIAQNLTQVEEIFLDFVDMSLVDLGSFNNLSSSLSYLSLTLCHLNGQLPESVFQLPNLLYLNLMLNDDVHGSFPKSNWSSPLQVLNVGSSNFSGELPDSIGSLYSLMVLDVSSCHLTGPIPATFASLVQLVRLDLSNNNFTGKIPDVFSKLSQLNRLSFASNNFSGMLPSSVFNISELEWLDLSQNQLEGSIPDNICSLMNLTYLDLSYNLLSDIIPYCLFGLPSIKTFYLNKNQLSGELGEFKSKSLNEIRLEDNKIYGSIPPSIFELVNLTNLQLSSNNLSGVVDLNTFSKLKKLWGLDLSFNSLSVTIGGGGSNLTWPQFYRLALSSCNVSEFPDLLRTQNQLNFLSLSNNRIHGEIPKWLWGSGMQNLQYLDLSHNFLTGVNELPTNLQFLDVSSNLLHQPLPLLPQTMYMIFFSNNNLTGEIPPLICNITTLMIIDLSNNSLSGRIPQCLGNFSSELSVLNLQKNNFHGTIPEILMEDNKLRNLELNGNQLEGQIPRSLVNCKMLEVLDLGNNQINDSFPQWLETLPKLQVLVLRSNRFRGPIGNPTATSPFSSLRIIDLSNNDFTGPLPSQYLANLQAMLKVEKPEKQPTYMGEIYYQDSIFLTFKGSGFELVRILTIFTAIDLSNNKFEGKIPDTVGDLSSLLVLNFSHNSISGRIPESLGNLISLESLDLSFNKLGGGIPQQLTNLNFLQVLNVSYNHLEGSIPAGNQFNTFPSNSYMGNSGLCGFPLSEKCSIDVAPQVPPSTSHEEDDSGSIFDWKFALMGYGFGLVFGLSAGYMVFSTGKPQRFVRMIEGLQQKRSRRRN